MQLYQYDEYLVVQEQKRAIPYMYLNRLALLPTILVGGFGTVGVLFRRTLKVLIKIPIA